MEARADAGDLVQRVARPLMGSHPSYDELLGLIGHARFVLIGEASHGTDEFYRQRAEITKRLIVEKGFNAVTVEADWPDAYRVNRYVRGAGTDRDAGWFHHIHADSDRCFQLGEPPQLKTIPPALQRAMNGCS